MGYVRKTRRRVLRVLICIFYYEGTFVRNANVTGIVLYYFITVFIERIADYTNEQF